jgi:tetratricopeptide (TPR) repeat protein
MDPHDEPINTGLRRLWCWKGLVVSAICVIGLTVVVKLWSSRSRGNDQLPDAISTPGVLDALPDPQDHIRWTPPPSSYVGSEACRQCHEDRVDEFHATPHFRTGRLPRVAEQGEYFREDNGYQSRDPGIRFTMNVEDQRLTITSLVKQNDAIRTETRTVGMIFGAGSADEIYHTWQGDKLYELPVAYLHPLKMWANAPGFLDGTANLIRPVVPRCLECHTTYAAFRPGSTNAYDRNSVIHGVTCERCHGPGKDHVEFHQHNPDANDAHAIVNPSELSRSLQLDVCGQCHSNTTKRRTAPFSFRPGDQLEDHFRVDRNQRPEFDHTANHVRYLKESKCFQQSDTMTCSTCHDPHQAPTQDNSASIQQSCLVCHTKTDCVDRPNLAEAIRDKCLDCHMPRRPSMSVTFDTATENAMPLIQRRSHHITADADARQEVLLTWLQQKNDKSDAQQIEQLTAAIVNKHLRLAGQLVKEHRLLAAMGRYRDALALRPSAKTENELRRLGQQYRDQRLMLRRAMSLSDRHEYEASRQLLSVLLRKNPYHAVARAKFGALEAVAGRTDNAYRELEKAAEQNPDDPYATSMLGWLHYLAHEFDESENYYRRAIDIDPRNATILYQAAQVSFQSRRFEEARDRLHRSLETQPGRPAPLHLLALTLRELKQPDDAIVAARDAVAVTNQQNPTMLQTLAELHADLGQYNAAEEVIHRAIELASATSPQMVFDLKKLAAEFQLSRSKLEPR